METNDLKCLKIQFKVGSLLSFVLCVDTTLILELVLLYVQYDHAGILLVSMVHSAIWW